MGSNLGCGVKPTATSLPSGPEPHPFPLGSQLPVPPPLPPPSSSGDRLYELIPVNDSHVAMCQMIHQEDLLQINSNHSHVRVGIILKFMVGCRIDS